MMPFAPLRLSMMTFWPRARDTGSDTARATVSMVPPAGWGISIRMGRVGQAATCADGAAANRPPHMATNKAISRRDMPYLLVVALRKAHRQQAAVTASQPLARNLVVASPRLPRRAISDGDLVPEIEQRPAMVVPILPVPA